MVNHQIQLKPSLLARMFQLIMLCGIGCIWFQLFAFYVFFIGIILAIIAYILFLKRPQMVALAHLDRHIWSVQWSNRRDIEHMQLCKVVDCYLYMVLYFNQHKSANMIWRDQVTLKQWKQLKVMAKLV